MKKIRIIAGVMLRTALMLAPAVITYLCLNGTYPVLVNITSSLGVEFVWLLFFALGWTIVETVRRSKK